MRTCQVYYPWEARARGAGWAALLLPLALLHAIACSQKREQLQSAAPLQLTGPQLLKETLPPLRGTTYC